MSERADTIEPRKFFGMSIHLVPAGTAIDGYGPHASVRKVTANSAVLGVGECWMTPAMFASVSSAYANAPPNPEGA